MVVSRYIWKKYFLFTIYCTRFTDNFLEYQALIRNENFFKQFLELITERNEK